MAPTTTILCTDDRMNNIKAFDESKAGVKGLSDSGITTIPDFFVHPVETLSNLKTSSTSIGIPTIDFSYVNSKDHQTLAGQLGTPVLVVFSGENCRSRRYITHSTQLVSFKSNMANDTATARAIDGHDESDLITSTAADELKLITDAVRALPNTR